MKVDYFLLADYANISEGGKANIMGIFHDLHATNFPVRHPSMHIVIGMSPELGEFGDTRKITVKLLDPDGAELLKISGEIKIPDPQGGRKPTVNAILNLRDVTFPKPGPYQFALLLDRDHKGQLSLYVNEIKVNLGESPKAPDR